MNGATAYNLRSSSVLRANTNDNDGVRKAKERARVNVTHFFYLPHSLPEPQLLFSLLFSFLFLFRLVCLSFGWWFCLVAEKSGCHDHLPLSFCQLLVGGFNSTFCQTIQSHCLAADCAFCLNKPLGVFAVPHLGLPQQCRAKHGVPITLLLPLLQAQTKGRQPLVGHRWYQQHGGRRAVGEVFDGGQHR